MYSAMSLPSPAPLHIHSLGRYSLAAASMGAFDTTQAVASTAWPANNRAIYVPIRTDVTTTYARGVVINGTNATGNADVGIYDAAGTRLTSSGSTARTGTTTLDFYPVTDLVLPPGFYYLGIVLSSTTGTVQGIVPTTVPLTRATGCLQEALGATTLPSSMTGVSMASAFIPCFGYSQSDTV